MTLQQLIDAACLQLNRPSMPVDAIAESLLDQVFQDTGRTMAASRRTRSLLKKTITLTVTDGTATLPDYVLTSCMEDSTVIDEDNLDIPSGYEREWFDFVGPLDDKINHYTVRNESEFYYREAGEDFAIPLGFDGALLLNTPCVPQKPVNASTQIDVIPEVQNELIRGLVNALGAINAQNA